MIVNSPERPSDGNASSSTNLAESGPIRHLRKHDQEILRNAMNKLGTIVVQHFEQRDRPADYHSKRTTNKPKLKKPFPTKRVIRRLSAKPVEIEGEGGAVMDPRGTKRPKVLSLRQFQALYDAIACSSGWWPLADVRWDSRSYFSRLEKYVLYLDEMPIGFGALERNREGPNVTRIVFVGVIPAMQGYRCGFYLFNFINHLAREGGTETVVLNTAPEFDVMKGAGKPKQSAVKMYLGAGFKLVRTEVVDAKQAAASGQRLEALNLPAYYRNNPLFSKELLLKHLCEEFHCQMPQLPMREKGR